MASLIKAYEFCLAYLKQQDAKHALSAARERLPQVERKIKTQADLDAMYRPFVHKHLEPASSLSKITSQFYMEATSQLAVLLLRVHSEKAYSLVYVQGPDESATLCFDPETEQVTKFLVQKDQGRLYEGEIFILPPAKREEEAIVIEETATTKAEAPAAKKIIKRKPAQVKRPAADGDALQKDEGKRQHSESVEEVKKE